MAAAKKSSTDVPDLSELADTLEDCASTLLNAHTSLSEAGNARGAKAIQSVEPAVRRAADALRDNLADVTAALGQAAYEPTREDT